MLWYDRKGRMITIHELEALLRDKEYKRVALTDITSSTNNDVHFRISTVWLGLDHSYGDGDPVLFETMVFGGTNDQDNSMWRWGTEEQAMAGHAEIVTTVAATITDEIITHLDRWPQES